MLRRVAGTARIWIAGAALMSVGACSSTDWEAIATGLDMAADDMAVTLTQVAPYGCDYNAQGYAVCDDSGDGFADRYAEDGWDYVPVYSSGPLIRVNDYGEAYQYDGSCDCWYREPSLDTYPD